MHYGMCVSMGGGPMPQFSTHRVHSDQDQAHFRWPIDFHTGSQGGVNWSDYEVHDYKLAKN